MQGEAQTVPAAAPCQLTRVCAWALGERSRRRLRRDRRALSPVAPRPAPGNMSVAGGVYAFSAADAGKAVSISYGYVPQDIAQAALELAAERFRAAEHIGAQLEVDRRTGDDRVRRERHVGADPGDAAAL